MSGSLHRAVGCVWHRGEPCGGMDIGVESLGAVADLLHPSRKPVKVQVPRGSLDSNDSLSQLGPGHLLLHQFPGNPGEASVQEPRTWRPACSQLFELHQGAASTCSRSCGRSRHRRKAAFHERVDHQAKKTKNKNKKTLYPTLFTFPTPY